SLPTPAICISPPTNSNKKFGTLGNKNTLGSAVGAGATKTKPLLPLGVHVCDLLTPPQYQNPVSSSRAKTGILRPLASCTNCGAAVSVGVVCTAQSVELVARS